MALGQVIEARKIMNKSLHKKYIFDACNNFVKIFSVNNAITQLIDTIVLKMEILNIGFGMHNIVGRYRLILILAFKWYKDYAMHQIRLSDELTLM